MLVLNGPTESFNPHFSLLVRLYIHLEIELSCVQVEFVAKLDTLFVLAIIEFYFHDDDKGDNVVLALTAR